MQGCITILILGILIFAMTGEFGEVVQIITIAIVAVIFISAFIKVIVQDFFKEEQPAKAKTSNSAAYLEETKEKDIQHPLPATPIVIKLPVQQFQNIKSVIYAGKAYCEKLSCDDELRKDFASIAARNAANDDLSDFSPTLFQQNLTTFFTKDLLECFTHLGYDLNSIANLNEPSTMDCSTVEGQALYATLALILQESYDFQSFRDEILSINQDSTSPSYNKEFRKLTEHSLALYSSADARMAVKGMDDFNMVLLLHVFNRANAIPAMRQIYYEFSLVIATIDKDISPTEQAWLTDLSQKLKSTKPTATNEHKKHSNHKPSHAEKPTSTSENEEATSVEPIDEPDPIDQLNELIGLKQVKNDLQSLTQFITVNEKRREAGLRVAAISYHCVFTGNPGTGKTTVARILAKIYKKLGILKQGQLVETDRSGLVAEYVGQTAVKTNKIIDKALGGVLFIDEAYTLAQKSDNDYGHEAIATLLKRMEDDRDQLVVILAGYTSEIEQFINSNPGLRSRFNRYVHFDDYSCDELFQIFILQARKYDYTLDDNAKVVLQELLQHKVASQQKDFGNARYVRNLFEKVIEHQATRLAASPQADKEALALITAADVYE